MIVETLEALYAATTMPFPWLLGNRMAEYADVYGHFPSFEAASLGNVEHGSVCIFPLDESSIENARFIEALVAAYVAGELIPRG